MLSLLLSSLLLCAAPAADSTVVNPNTPPPLPAQEHREQIVLPTVTAEEMFYADRFDPVKGPDGKVISTRPIWKIMKKADFYTLLADTSRESAVKALTIVHMSYYPPELPRVLPLMERYATAEDEELRGLVLLAAGEYESLAILPLHRKILNGPFADDREQTLQNLFNMPWGKQVEGMVASALWDENEDVREIALAVINNSIEDSYDTVEDARKVYQRFGPNPVVDPNAEAKAKLKKELLSMPDKPAVDSKKLVPVQPTAVPQR